MSAEVRRLAAEELSVEGSLPIIGLLYESDEWSDHKLAAELLACGCPVRMVDMERDGAVDGALACDLLVSRVFASAQFRGHRASHEHMEQLVGEAARRSIPLVNSGRAHFFEVDKHRAAEALARAGLVVPAVYALGVPNELDPHDFAFPCVIKPNCGGRTTFTAIAHDEAESRAFLADAPVIAFIVEEYVQPERGFLSRIEVVDGVCALVVKRSIAPCGLSAYHLGSTYELYNNCPADVCDAVERAAHALGILHGSFDVIEGARGACIIDANSVSNVSEDCTELFGFDLMRAHAEAIARQWRALCEKDWAHKMGKDGPC